MVVKLIRMEALAALPSMPYWMDVDDLVSIGWLGYVMALRRVDNHRNPKQYIKMWIRGEIRNAIREWYGTGRTEFDFHLHAWDTDLDLPSESHESEEDRIHRERLSYKRIEKMLAPLTADQRRAVWMRYVENTPYKEIASHLGVTTHRASALVHTAIGKLRRQSGNKQSVRSRRRRSES